MLSPAQLRRPSPPKQRCGRSECWRTRRRVELVSGLRKQLRVVPERRVRRFQVGTVILASATAPVCVRCLRWRAQHGQQCCGVRTHSALDGELRQRWMVDCTPPRLRVRPCRRLCGRLIRRRRPARAVAHACAAARRALLPRADTTTPAPAPPTPRVVVFPRGTPPPRAARRRAAWRATAARSVCPRGLRTAQRKGTTGLAGVPFRLPRAARRCATRRDTRGACVQVVYTRSARFLPRGARPCRVPTAPSASPPASRAAPRAGRAVSARCLRARASYSTSSALLHCGGGGSSGSHIGGGIGGGGMYICELIIISKMSASSTVRRWGESRCGAAREQASNVLLTDLQLYRCAFAS